MDQEEEIEQDLSNEESEQMDKLFELMESLPTLSLGRNDLCSCGSGLKYKKCCLGKNKKTAFSTMRVESFDVTTDPLTPEEAKHNFPPLSPEDEKLMDTLYYNLHAHPDTIDSENCEHFQKLNALHARYPDNPKILNYLTNAYAHLGQQDQAEKLIAKAYETCPDYLFAKTAQAGLYFRDGFLEKAIEIFNGAHTLKQLYPHRTVFHVSEAKAFAFFMFQYCCEKKKIEQAGLHLKILEQILEENDPLLQSAQNIFKNLKLLHKFQVIMSRLPRLAKKER